jgi:hypothetical protein
LTFERLVEGKLVRGRQKANAHPRHSAQAAFRHISTFKLAEGRGRDNYEHGLRRIGPAVVQHKASRIYQLLVSQKMNASRADIQACPPIILTLGYNDVLNWGNWIKKQAGFNVDVTRLRNGDIIWTSRVYRERPLQDVYNQFFTDSRGALTSSMDEMLEDSVQRAPSGKLHPTFNVASRPSFLEQAFMSNYSLPEDLNEISYSQDFRAIASFTSDDVCFVGHGYCYVRDVLEGAYQCFHHFSHAHCVSQSKLRENKGQRLPFPVAFKVPDTAHLINGKNLSPLLLRRASPDLLHLFLVDIAIWRVLRVDIERGRYVANTHVVGALENCPVEFELRGSTQVRRIHKDYPYWLTFAHMTSYHALGGALCAMRRNSHVGRRGN